MAAPRSSPTSRAPELSALVAHDLNGDGKPDLAVASDTGGNVTVLSTWATAASPPRSTIAGLNPRAVVAADMNGDGQPDLVTANYDADSVSVLLNLGNGSFAAHRIIPQARSPCDRGRRPERRRQLDLAIGTTYPPNSLYRSVSVLLSRGDGSFKAKRHYPRMRRCRGRDWRPERRREAGSGCLSLTRRAPE